MEKTRYPMFLMNDQCRSQKKTSTSNSFPTYEQGEEESLIPSDLLNESEIDFYPKKMLHYHHPKSQSPTGRQVTSAPAVTSQKEAQRLFFETEMKSMISQLKTHYGSICFQNALSSLSNDDINSLLIRLCPFLIDLMCSHYGNYFIQKLFQKLNYNQRLLIFSIIQYHFLQLCTDKSGTYSIQSLIDVIKTPDEEKIMQSLLMQNLLLLICNENGHHIIQKIIIDFPEHKREFLNKFFFENVEKICMNEYGALCMVKFIIMNSNLNLRNQLIKSLERNIYQLFSNKFSCQVLLFLMEKYGFAYSTFIINEIKKNILFFSTQNALTVSLVEKSMELLIKFDNNSYNILSWSIIKSDKIINKMNQSENGKVILLSILKHLTNEQKNYFRSKKVNSVINDQVTYETIMHSIL